MLAVAALDTLTDPLDIALHSFAAAVRAPRCLTCNEEVVERIRPGLPFIIWEYGVAGQPLYVFAQAG